MKHTRQTRVRRLLPWGITFALGFGPSACESGNPNNEADPAASGAGLAAGLPAADTDGEGAAAPEAHLEQKSRGEQPKPVAPQAKAAFEEMVSLIDAKYVDGALDEDRLYTAAMRGVMDELIQMPHHEINALMSPEELGRLLEGTKGEVVGVGVKIEMVGDLLVVHEAIAGGPAEAVGLRGGDRILAVNGTRLGELGLHGAVDAIRGEAGTKVELFVQRDTEEWAVEVERAAVKVPNIEARMVDAETGYLRILGFAETTGEETRASLKALDEEGMKRLVLDLRACPGGLLEGAIEVAELFLPPEKRIVTIRGRKGEEHRQSEKADAWDALPLTVLIGPKTASGAEILASALAEHERALLIGAPTMGKGTVEAVHDLSNGWALKLSMARFYSPQGVERQGQGVQPDIPAEGHPPKAAFATPEEDPALSVALRVARLAGE